MTRKDYIVIAAAIRTAPINLVTKQEVAMHMADHLLADNPERFDPDRFIEAATQEDSA